jgi:hypothetical protein
MNAILFRNVPIVYSQNKALGASPTTGGKFLCTVLFWMKICRKPLGTARGLE